MCWCSRKSTVDQYQKDYNNNDEMLMPFIMICVFSLLIVTAIVGICIYKSQNIAKICTEKK